jgi:hypothetical protein
MNGPFPHGKKLLLFLGLNLLDLALTRWLIHPGYAEFREVNPLASWVLRGGGWAGLASFKLAMMVVAAALFVVISRYRPRAGSRALDVSCVAVGVVVLYSGYLAASNGGAVADLDRQQHASEKLQQKSREAAADRAALEALAKDLAAGRSTLSEACARWRSRQPADPTWLPRLRAALGRESDDECLAIMLVRNAVISLGHDPAAARALFDHLAQDFRTAFGHPPPESPFRSDPEFPAGTDDRPAAVVSDLFPPP